MPTHEESKPPRWDGHTERRAPELEGIGLILHRISAVEVSQSNLNDSVNELVRSMTKLALAEERIAQVNEAIGRAFKEISKQGDQFTDLQKLIDGRLSRLEQAAPLNRQANNWVFGAVAGLALAAAVFVGAHTGLVK